MCVIQSTNHILAKLVHKMRVFRDEDTEWLFDLQLDRFESSDDKSCADVFSSDIDKYELVEVDLSEFSDACRQAPRHRHLCFAASVLGRPIEQLALTDRY